MKDEILRQLLAEYARRRLSKVFYTWFGEQVWNEMHQKD
jgi:DNA-binding TFAR19-related protein (PDSD5 family)